MWLHLSITSISTTPLFLHACHILCAGKLDESNPDVEASSYGAADLWDLNFDGLADAYAVLFFLLVLNDWPLMMEGTTAAVGKGARVYFMVFWLVCTVQCLNVVRALLSLLLVCSFLSGRRG